MLLYISGILMFWVYLLCKSPDESVLRSVDRLAPSGYDCRCRSVLACCIMQTFIFTNDGAIFVAFQYTLAMFVVSAFKLLTIGIVVSVRHKFKVLGSVIILDFILMIYNESFFVTINKMKGYKSVYLGTNMQTRIGKHNSLIASRSIFRLYYPAFVMPGMNGSSACGHDVTVKAAHTPHIADLIATLKSLHVFPNFILHLAPPALLFVPTASV